MSVKPRVIVIAGPNGAGKTTFAREFLPQEANCPTFLNADLIAAGLAPFAPEKAALRAGRLMLEEIAAQVAKRNSFAFETTLSGLNYVRHIQQWRVLGYHISIIFLSLPSADFAVSRVAARVAQGGHNIPEETVRRRFNSGLKNFLEPTNRWPMIGHCLIIRERAPSCLPAERTHESSPTHASCQAG